MIRYEIMMDERHLAVALNRRRRLGLGRYIRGVAKVICLIGLLLLLVAFILARRKQK